MEKKYQKTINEELKKLFLNRLKYLIEGCEIEIKTWVIQLRLLTKSILKKLNLDGDEHQKIVDKMLGWRMASTNSKFLQEKQSSIEEHYFYNSDSFLLDKYFNKWKDNELESIQLMNKKLKKFEKEISEEQNYYLKLQQESQKKNKKLQKRKKNHWEAVAKFRVQIYEAKGLLAKRKNKICNPFIKINLGRYEGRSTTIRNTTEPKWCPAEKFEFEVFDIVNDVIELNLFDEIDPNKNFSKVAKFKIESCKFLGKVTFPVKEYINSKKRKLKKKYGLI